MNIIVLFGALVNCIAGDLIGWNRQHAVSYKSRQSANDNSSNYRDALLKHMLTNGDMENAKRLIAFLHSKNLRK